MDSSTLEELFPQNGVQVNELLARTALYQLLAVLFQHPASFKVKDWIEQNSSLWYSAIEVLRGVKELELKRSLIVLLNQIRKTTHEEWVRQHESCLGHTVHSKVPAYELEYGEEHSHREPQELADIAAFYQAFGVQNSARARERADHVSCECEFMYFLLYKEAYAVSSGKDENAIMCGEASHRFLADHLGRWLPAFAFRLSKYAGRGLMKWIAQFALAFILEECETQEVEAGPCDLPIRAIQEKEETGCVSCQYGPALANRREG